MPVFFHFIIPEVRVTGKTGECFIELYSILCAWVFYSEIILLFRHSTIFRAILEQNTDNQKNY